MNEHTFLTTYAANLSLCPLHRDIRDVYPLPEDIARLPLSTMNNNPAPLTVSALYRQLAPLGYNLRES